MANVLQNAAFADSLFKPVSQILTGFGESNLQTEQLNYKDRLRQIAREQELADQQEKYDQAVAVENLRTSGALAVANETTKRYDDISKRADQRAREMAEDNRLAALKLAYANARGTKRPKEGATVAEQIDFYSTELGPQLEDQDYGKEYLKARDELVSTYGGEADEFDEGTPNRDRLFRTKDKISARKGMTAREQAAFVFDRQNRYNAELDYIQKPSADDLLAADNAGLRAAAATNPKVDERLKVKGVRESLRSPEDIAVFLDAFGGRNEFDGARVNYLDQKRKERADKSDVLPTLARDLQGTAATYLRNPLVQGYLGELESHVRQGGNPDSWRASFGDAGLAADVRANLGGGTAAPAKPPLRPGTVTSDDIVASVNGQTLRQPTQPGAAAPQPAVNNLIAPRAVDRLNPWAASSAGLGTPARAPIAAPVARAAAPQAGVLQGNTFDQFTPLGPEEGAAAPAVSRFQGNTFDRFTPLAQFPEERLAAAQQLGGATPDTDRNINTRRNNAVTDFFRNGAQTVGRVLDSDNWQRPSGGSLAYKPSAESLAQDLLARYDALDDKTSPLAIGLLKQAAQLVSAPGASAAPTPVSSTVMDPYRSPANMLPSPPVEFSVNGPIPTVSSNPPVQFNTDGGGIQTVSSRVPPVEFNANGPMPMVSSRALPRLFGNLDAGLPAPLPGEQTPTVDTRPPFYDRYVPTAYSDGRDLPVVRTDRSPPRVSMGDRLTEGLAPWRESTEVNPERADAIFDTLRSTGQALIRPFSPGGDIEKDLRSRLAAMRDKDSPRAKKLKAQIKEFEDERESYKKRKTSTRRSADEIDAEILSDRKQPASYNRGSDRLTRTEAKALDKLNERFDNADPDSEEADALLNEIIARTPVGRALPVGAYTNMPRNPISARLSDDELYRMMLNQLRPTR